MGFFGKKQVKNAQQSEKPGKAKNTKTKFDASKVINSKAQEQIAIYNGLKEELAKAKVNTGKKGSGRATDDPQVGRLIGKMWQVYMAIASDEEVKKGKESNAELKRWIDDEETFLHSQS